MTYYLHILSKDGLQKLCNSQDGNKKELSRLMGEGWIVQQTQEFTNLETAIRTRRQIAECMKDITR
jgi:hypothetical protein